MPRGRGTEGMAFRRQRDECPEFLRRHAAELRACGLAVGRRLWEPAVRSRFRLCVWITFGGFAAAGAVWFAVAELCRSAAPTADAEGYFVVYDILRDGIGVAPVAVCLGML